MTEEKGPAFTVWNAVQTAQYDPDHGSYVTPESLFSCNACAALVDQWGRDPHARWHDSLGLSIRLHSNPEYRKALAELETEPQDPVDAAEFIAALRRRLTDE